MWRHWLFLVTKYFLVAMIFQYSFRSQIFSRRHSKISRPRLAVFSVKKTSLRLTKTKTNANKFAFVTSISLTCRDDGWGIWCLNSVPESFSVTNKSSTVVLDFSRPRLVALRARKASLRLTKTICERKEVYVRPFSIL